MSRKQLLKEMLHEKFCYLEMDACTRHRVNYFAMNVQFMNDNDKLTVHTLALRDSHALHAGHFLKCLVEEVLKEFNISKQHLLAVVTDNAANMTHSVENFNTESEVSEGECIAFGLNTSDDSEQEEMVFDAVSKVSNSAVVEHMQCAVHTLLLAIRDGLKEKHAQNLISKIRQVVLVGRTSKIDEILKRRVGKNAVIDQATRWGRTYLMIQRLLEIKDSLVDMARPDISMTESQWKQVEKLEALLRLLYLVTKKLPEADLTPGLFYKQWKDLIFTLSKIDCMIADAIKSSMIRR